MEENKKEKAKTKKKDEVITPFSSEENILNENKEVEVSNIQDFPKSLENNFYSFYLPVSILYFIWVRSTSFYMPRTRQGVALIYKKTLPFRECFLGCKKLIWRPRLCWRL